MTSDLGTCPRCGIRRYIHTTRSPNLCHSCNLVEAKPATTQPLPPGRWVQIRGVQMYLPTIHRDGKPGRPRHGETYRWDNDEARRAHAAYVRGDYDSWSIEGERVYSRWAKQRQTARRQQQREAA